MSLVRRCRRRCSGSRCLVSACLLSGTADTAGQGLDVSLMYVSCPAQQTPLGQINMREARVEEVERVSDSEGEETPEEEIGHGGGGQEDLTIAIFPNNQGPTYLIMPTKQDKVTPRDWSLAIEYVYLCTLKGLCIFVSIYLY